MGAKSTSGALNPIQPDPQGRLAESRIYRTPSSTVPCQKSSRNLVKSRKIATHQNHALISTSHHAMNRTPLGPINGNKTHRKELTPFTRGFILGKLTSNITPPQIKREIHAPRSIIRSVLRAVRI